LEGLLAGDDNAFNANGALNFHWQLLEGQNTSPNKPAPAHNQERYSDLEIPQRQARDVFKSSNTLEIWKPRITLFVNLAAVSNLFYNDQLLLFLNSINYSVISPNSKPILAPQWSLERFA
jgi:hypothetical protein